MCVPYNCWVLSFSNALEIDVFLINGFANLAVQPFNGCQSSLETENGCANLHNCLERVHAKCANVHSCLGPTLER